MRSGRRVRLVLVAAIASIAGLAVGQLAIAANTPGGNPTPANKAVASGDTLKVVGPGEEVELLSAVLRTSKPTDLLLQTSLECSILTKLQTGPATDSPASDTASAEGTISAYIEIDDDATHGGVDATPARRVPITSASQPPQNGSQDDDGDEVTFCNRAYQRTVEDPGDTLGEGDGLDRETDYIDTKTANAFNWVLLNAGSGVHYVRLIGTLNGTPQMSATCGRTTTDMGSTPSCTSGYIGNRTLIIEPTKMANDAVVGPTGS